MSYKGAKDTFNVVYQQEQQRFERHAQRLNTLNQTGNTRHFIYSSLSDDISSYQIVKEIVYNGFGNTKPGKVSHLQVYNYHKFGQKDRIAFDFYESINKEEAASINSNPPYNPLDLTALVFTNRFPVEHYNPRSQEQGPSSGYASISETLKNFFNEESVTVDRASFEIFTEESIQNKEMILENQKNLLQTTVMEQSPLKNKVQTIEARDPIIKHMWIGIEPFYNIPEKDSFLVGKQLVQFMCFFIIFLPLMS